RGVERQPGAEQLVPPVAHARRAGQGVANQHHVVGFLPAVEGIVHRDRLEAPAAVEEERRVGGEGEVTLETGLRPRGHLPVPWLALRAWSRSARMSRTSSIPTDSRTISGVTPVARCSSADSCWCVVEAGWITSDLASPMLASRLNSLTELM